MIIIVSATSAVIPAKAEIQDRRSLWFSWTPAFAGVMDKQPKWDKSFRARFSG
jgi:hypothetical protein